MRISVKGRYAIAAVTQIASSSTDSENISVNSIAENLGISKIYLEQVFSQLKKSGILTSAKGPKGGYQLSASPEAITAWDILTTLETGLTEKTEETVREEAPGLESAMHEKVFDPLDEAIKNTLMSINIRQLIDSVDEQGESLAFMLNM